MTQSSSSAYDITGAPFENGERAETAITRPAADIVAVAPKLAPTSVGPGRQAFEDLLRFIAAHGDPDSEVIVQSPDELFAEGE